MPLDNPTTLAPSIDRVSGGGVYIHVPYCLQICPYCDFTKYEVGKILAPKNYISLVHDEIRLKAPALLNGETTRSLDTIYFGGGTPSLLDPDLILSVITSLANAGFVTGPNAEVTIEIDPATVDAAKLDRYLEIGINRFSVGAQTFNERLLKIAGRKHSAQDTVDLLTLLKSRQVNYSFDLLFALPSQTLEELRADVATALAFNPSHLSAYCLTVPESHPMALGRAPEDEQTEMFALIERTLAASGILRYEISNFARAGAESQHNLRYWTDREYWGLGVSSHSYFPKAGDWGVRSWNAPSIKTYEKDIEALRSRGQAWSLLNDTPAERLELLKFNQSLTDFCHTSLRLTRGLNAFALSDKFGQHAREVVGRRLSVRPELIVEIDEGWRLSSEGQLLANTVFEMLTFLEDEIRPAQI